MRQFFLCGVGCAAYPLLRGTQAGSQVLRFGGVKYIFLGERFLLYFLKKIFWTQQNFGENNKIRGLLAPKVPSLVATVLVIRRAIKANNLHGEYQNQKKRNIGFIEVRRKPWRQLLKIIANLI